MLALEVDLEVGFSRKTGHAKHAMNLAVIWKWLEDCDVKQ